MTSRSRRRFIFGTLEWTPKVLLGACLLGLPLAKGGAHPTTNAWLAGAMVLALLIHLAGRNFERRIVLGLPAIALLVAIGATLMQLVPLPLWLFERFARGTFEVLSVSYPTGAWAPASLDLPATCHAVLQQTACLCGAILATELYCNGAGRRRDLYALIGFSGGLTMLVALALLAPEMKVPASFSATFINANHFGSYLGFAALVALAAAMSHSGPLRWVMLACGPFAIVGVFFSDSRGALVAILIAALFWALTWLAGRRTRDGRWALGWVAGCISAFAIAAAIIVAGVLPDSWWKIGEARGFAKTAIWEPVPKMLSDFAMLGVGRGAFFSAYTRYSEAHTWGTFTHLENEWLQTLVDWGPIAGTPLLLLVVVAFGRALLRAWARPEHLMACAALLMLSLHNLVGFSLAVTATAFPAVMVLSVLTSPRRRSTASEVRQTGTYSLPMPAAWALAAGCAAMLLFASSAIRYEINLETRNLRTSLEGAEKPDVDPMLRRHAGDFYLPLLVAQAELETRDGAQRALSWVNRSMRLAPHHAEPHRIAARALMRMGRQSQALLEYRLCLLSNPRLTKSVSSEVLRTTKRLDDIVALAVEDREVRHRLARFLIGRDARMALAMLQRGELGDNSADLELASAAHMKLGEHQEAADTAARAERLEPERVKPYQLQIQALWAAGEEGRALEVINRGLSAVEAPDELLIRKSAVLLKLGRFEEALATAETLRRRAGGRKGRARAHALRAAVFSAQGESLKELREYEDARREHPGDLRYSLTAAELRIGIGDLTGARRILESARPFGAGNRRLARAFERLRQMETSSEIR